MSRNLKIEQADLKYAPQKAELITSVKRRSTNIRLYLLFVFHPFSLQCLRTVIGADAQVNLLVKARAVSQSDSNHSFLKRK